jgi:hypothetical protein
MFVAAAFLMIVGGNSGAKFLVFKSADRPASPQRQAIHRFGALILVISGALLAPLSLVLPFRDVPIGWMIGMITIVLLFAGRSIVGVLGAQRSH